MLVALCCVGRLENRYAREFVEYYLNLSFDHIFIYDNNEPTEDNFLDVIGDYVEQDKVSIIPWNHSHSHIQRKIYQDCWKNNRDTYDWLAFFDFDEFLTLTNHVDIKDYLSDSTFDDYDMIHFNWMGYNDNNLIRYDDRGVLERFIQPYNFDFKKKYAFPENNHIKSMIRCCTKGRVDWERANNPHTPKNSIQCCNNKGDKCDSNSPFVKYNFDWAYIKHFSTKTIEEWLTNKLKRGLLEQPRTQDITKDLSLDVFFTVNEISEEKINFISEFHEKSVKKYQDIQLFLEKNQKK